MNDFLRGLGQSITQAANDVTDKTEEFFEVTKIRGQISGEEKIIRQAYAKLGEILYKEYTEGTVVSETIADICKDVDAHKERIEALEKDLAYLRGKKE